MRVEDLSLPDWRETIEELLSSGGEIVLTVTGTSMVPFLRPERDAVTIERADSFKKGDIVLYVRPNEAFVLHRIVAVEDSETLCCCGDGQVTQERGVLQDSVVGRVRIIHRGDRKIPVQSAFYVLLVKLWMFTTPLRPWYLRVRRYCFAK